MPKPVRRRRVSALSTGQAIKSALEQLSSFANPPEADKGLLASGELPPPLRELWRTRRRTGRRGHLFLAGNTATGITRAMLVTSKGQVTIPQRIRNRHGLKPGTAVEFTTEGNKVVLKPKRRRTNVGADWLAEARGFLKGKSTDALMKLTRGVDSFASSAP